MTREEVKELLGIEPQDTQWDDLDEMVHEQHACDASEVNNKGIEEQIQFFARFWMGTVGLPVIP